MVFRRTLIIRCSSNNQSANNYMSKVQSIIASILCNFDSSYESSYISFGSDSCTFRNFSIPAQQTIEWTSRVIIRIQFDLEAEARRFHTLFNRISSQQFHFRNTQKPYSHFGQTPPERALRRMLTEFCVRKNFNGGTIESYQYETFELVSRILYFHDGVQLFKVCIDFPKYFRI